MIRPDAKGERRRNQLIPLSATVLRDSLTPNADANKVQLCVRQSGRLLSPSLFCNTCISQVGADRSAM